MTFAADGGAERALAATRGLLAFFGLQGVSPSSTAVAIGDRSQVFVKPKGYPPGPQPSPETAVAWRSGDVYAFVVTSARTQADATAAAVTYARAQQARISRTHAGRRRRLRRLPRPAEQPEARRAGLVARPRLRSARLTPFLRTSTGGRCGTTNGPDYGPGSDRRTHDYARPEGARPPGGALPASTPGSRQDWKRWIERSQSAETGVGLARVPGRSGSTSRPERRSIWSGYWKTPKTPALPEAGAGRVLRPCVRPEHRPDGEQPALRLPRYCQPRDRGHPGRTGLREDWKRSCAATARP